MRHSKPEDIKAYRFHGWVPDIVWCMHLMEFMQRYEMQDGRRGCSTEHYPK